MGADVKHLLAADTKARSVLSAVLASPFADHQTLAETVGVSAAELDAIVAPWVEKMVLLELASQADSNVESRVPKRVYLVNPDFEAVVREGT